jgi:hypothetical protein
MCGEKNVVQVFSLLFLLPLWVISLAAAVTKEQPSTRADSTSEVENIRVTDASSGFPYQAEPSIVVDGQGRFFAGWKEMNEIGGANRVGFGRSLDGGRTWEKTLVEVATPDQGQSDPWLALDELDRVYYARTQSVCRSFRDCPPGLAGIVVSRFDDGSLASGPMVNVHVQQDFSDKASVRSDGNGTIYASYVTAGLNAPRGMKIIATRSLDAGRTWGPSRVVVTGLNPFAPAVATHPNGTAYIVWWAPAGDIMVTATEDRGETWRAPVRVNPSRGSAEFYGGVHPNRIPYPWPATNSAGSLFVAWADKGKGEYNIVVARSDDGGTTWSGPVQVNDVDPGDQWMAVLAVDANDMLHAAWFDARTGNINLYYANSRDGGRTWSPNLRITTAETPSTALSLGEYVGLAADRDGAAYMVWTDGRDGGSAIYFARTAGRPLVPAKRSPPVRAAPRDGKRRVVPPRN